MTKRPRSASPQGELQPHPVKPKIGDYTMSSQIDDQTVFSQLDMDVPQDALVEDDTIADDILDKDVNIELTNQTENNRRLLRSAARYYRVDHESCSDAVQALASVLLPAILEDKQHTKDHQSSLVANYKDTIKHNPWLVKVLVDAYNKQTYGNIRRIGLLRG
jgi:hypothetical protein